MTRHYSYKNSLSKALKTARVARGLNQEAFGIVSSRTYVSSLERGLKIPTIDKIDDLSAVLGIHPLTLLTLSYIALRGSSGVDELIGKVRQEVLEIVEPA
jgi:transcriptional regulator with XRE-family HTH domain